MEDNFHDTFMVLFHLVGSLKASLPVIKKALKQFDLICVIQIWNEMRLSKWPRFHSRNFPQELGSK